MRCSEHEEQKASKPEQTGAASGPLKKDPEYQRLSQICDSSLLSGSHSRRKPFSLFNSNSIYKLLRSKAALCIVNCT